MVVWQSHRSAQKFRRTVKDKVHEVKAGLEAGTIVTFAGPIMDQDGNIKIKEGEVLTDDAMSNVDWFVKGVVGSPK